MSPPTGPSAGGPSRPGQRRRAGSTGPAPSAGIRPATSHDARSLAALMDTIYAEGRWFVGDMGPGAETLARQLRAIDPTREIVLVAEEEEAAGRVADDRVATDRSAARAGGLLGWIEARRYGPTRLEHVASLTIAVAPRARGRGVGGRLMRAIEPWARRVGVRKLRLDVRAGNEAALALYRAEGYEVEGVERDQIRDVDGFEDNIVMARFLDPER